jgi:hypothetical protein
MSDNDRKSMDDVLASIRRIVRHDKQDAGLGEPVDTGVASEETGEEPLLLTPEMRIDPAAEVAGAAAEHDAEASHASVEPAAAPPASDALSMMVRAVLRDELGEGPARDAVREIIRDELMNGEVGGNVTANVVRLVREEVVRAMSER